MGVGNKFATMLHRNTNKTIVILVYAVLEWLLISLLLLNSLFTFLITKYTDFFGLKHSCICCSTASLQLADSICDNHAAEISKLGYSVPHTRLLANSQQEMCQHCSMEKWQQQEEEEERDHAYNNLDYANRAGITIEELDGDGVDDEANKADYEHQMILSDVDSFGFREASEEECSKSFSNFRWHENEECHNHTLLLQSSSHVLEDDSVRLIDLQFMRTMHCSDNYSESLRLVPVDLIDSSMLIAENHQTLPMDSVMNLLDAPQVEEGGGHTQATHHNTEEATEEEELHKESEKTLLTGTDGESGQVKPFTNGAGEDEVQEESTNEEHEGRENEPETPTSLDSLQSLHKKLLLLSEKRESSIEESVDGSVDGGDGAVTVERLKSALTSERKTLRAVYAELEEERSASAIAANHTMAMITRLQEEKAAMQMEALQYQRMMEEQAEYDQEALQLLNDLMLKREKEKDELAKELEMYRRDHHQILNVIDGQDYYSDDDDDDARLSIDLNRPISIEKHNDNDNCVGSSSRCDDEDEDDDDEDGELEEMALDCMKHMSELDESLAEFEEEKLSILDQLRALEEKLLMMSGGEGSSEVGEDIIEKEETETMQLQSMAKQLLPLLDEAEDESAEMEINSSVQEAVEFSPSKKVVGAVEEVDRVYERLQALEEESMKEDEQGMNLLQEILQNLRDLKSVELRVPSTGGGIA